MLSRPAHRVAVFGVEPGEATPDGPTLTWRVRDVVSQSDVIGLIASRASTLGPTLAASLADLGLASPRRCPPLVHAGTPALAAFSAMRAARALCVGLVAGSESGEALEGEWGLRGCAGLRRWADGGHAPSLQSTPHAPPCPPSPPRL